MSKQLETELKLVQTLSSRGFYFILSHFVLIVYACSNVEISTLERNTVIRQCQQM